MMATPKKPEDQRVMMMKHLVDTANNRVPVMLRCTKCGTTALVSNKDKAAAFLVSFSPLHVGNDSKFPICRKCLNEMFEDYNSLLGSPSEAFRRICMKLDIYYSEELVALTMTESKPKERMSCYIRKSKLKAFANKTYDDTISEEYEREPKISVCEKIEEVQSVDPDTIKFWGPGFEPEDYDYLDNKYVEWSTSYPVQAKAMESIIQKICMMELQILKGIQRNEKVDALYRQLNDFMNAAGIQPKQSSENTMSDTASFGVLIKRWEDEDPIPEPEPQWKDVDGIRRYIAVYFVGHLSKMFGFKNHWAELYEKEIKKYTVEKPDLTDVDISTVSYEDIFGNGDSDE